MIKYRNNERIEQEERELAEEEAAYTASITGETTETQTNPLDNVGPDIIPTTKEEENWKKRHGDLRSYTSRQLNEKEKEINDLKKVLVDKEREAKKLPTNKDEAEEWIKEYPDLARVLATLIETQTEFVKEDVKTVRQELEAERIAMAKEKAINAVVKAHPDFMSLINEEDFKSWVEKQPLPKIEGGRGRIGQAIYDALYRNETDAEAAIEAVNVYKQDTEALKPKRNTSARDAATSVTKTSSSVPSGNSGKKTFSESEIDKMKPWEYDKLESEIEDARREGRLVYDISGAAR